MLEPRWRKILRDVWLHKARALLVALAMAISLAGAGTVLDAWAIVRRATTDGYLASDPASATIRTDSVDAALLARALAVPGVRAVQARATVTAAAQVQGRYRTAILYAMEDFSDVRIGRLSPEAGAWPPATGTFAVERSSLEFSGLAVGQPVRLSLGGGEPVALPVAGVVRDVGLAPGWMEHVVYGFVTTGTLRALGVPASLTELQLVVAARDASREEVRRIAWQVKDVLESTGHRVTSVDVPVPGEHIHAAQMDSLLLTQGAFGILALFVCGFLVVNLVSAMLAGQVREIGVMKTLGARPAQIAGMYLALALGLGAVATAVGVPAAAALGREYAGLKAELLNFPIDGVATPAWAILLQVVVGLLVPVAAAAAPVRRGCRASVASALRDFGIAHPGGTGRIDRVLVHIGGASRPTLLSIRNAFRQRQRMALTLLALAMGGAVFLGARNLRASVIGSLDLLFGSSRYDFSVRLSQPQDPGALRAAIEGVQGVGGAEAWGGARGEVRDAGGIPGNAFSITAVPSDSRLFAPPPSEGRWFAAGDTGVIVVNRSLRRAEPALAPGSEVRLAVNGQEGRWVVIGEVVAGPAPAAFIPMAGLARVIGGRVTAAVVAGSGGSLATQVDLIQRVRGALADAGMPVASSQLLSEVRRVTEDHLLMVVQFLGVMGWVMIAVGGMGLASTMSLAVLERTREIGVLRAIGARHRAIAGMIHVEGLVVALAGFVVALPLSLPMSVLLAYAFGRVMTPVPVTWVPEGAGVVQWLSLVVAVSLVASALPARRATRVPVARALAYE